MKQWLVDHPWMAGVVGAMVIVAVLFGVRVAAGDAVEGPSSTIRLAVVGLVNVVAIRYLIRHQKRVKAAEAQDAPDEVTRS